MRQIPCATGARDAAALRQAAAGRRRPGVPVKGEHVTMKAANDKRRSRRSWPVVVAVLVLGVALLAVAACGDSGDDGATGDTGGAIKTGGTLKIGSQPAT